MVDNNQEVEKCYTIEFDDKGMVVSILVEEVGGFGRWLYKRNPQGMELQLTDAIFEETVEGFLKNDIFKTDDLYVTLRAHDKYYANLMKKVFKRYFKKFMYESSLLRDAFFGD